MRNSPVACLILSGLLLAAIAGCSRGGGGRPQEAVDGGQAPAATSPKESTGGLAFDGVAPPSVGAGELPGPDGPFVEPPLLERPTQTHHVVPGCAKDLEAAQALVKAAAAIAAVPVGYPAVDWAGGSMGADCNWVVLAGKFARSEYAIALRDACRKAGMHKTVVVARPYRHDRFSPTLGPASNRRVGRVFAGVAGVGVPLLENPSQSAHGQGELADGTLVKIVERVEQEGRFWYHVSVDGRSGFLPAERLLSDYNVFPAADGQRAILALSLGCHNGACPRDYWLVDNRFSERRLVCPHSERLGQAFSADGKELAIACPGRPLALDLGGRRVDLSLGSGTSPSWSADGRTLFFRRPGKAGLRDEVMIARAPDWKAQSFFDFRGEPFYPHSLSAYPPAVDLLDGGKKLYTIFYRLVRRDGGVSVQRWKVLLTPDGKLISKKGEQLTE